MLIQEEVKDDRGLHKASYNVYEINRLKSVELNICFQKFTFLLFDCSFMVRNVFEITYCKAFEDVEKTSKCFGVQKRIQSVTKLMSCVDRHFSFLHCSRPLLSTFLGHVWVELG